MASDFVRCTCMSQSPGMTNLPLPSTILALAGIRVPGPTAVIFDPAMMTFARRASPRITSMTVTFRIAVVCAEAAAATTRRKRRPTCRQDNKWLSAKLPPQPGLCISQVMADSVDRQAKRLRRLLRGHAAEIPHFDQPRQRFVFRRQGFDGVVQLDQIQQLDTSVTLHLEVSRPLHKPARSRRPLLSGAGSGIVDQNLPHD